MPNLIDEKRLEELKKSHLCNVVNCLACDMFETISTTLRIVRASYTLCKAVEERNAGVVKDGADIVMALIDLEPLLVPFYKVKPGYK